MIRSLRQRHRWVIAALVAGLPIAVAAGLRARPGALDFSAEGTGVSPALGPRLANATELPAWNDPPVLATLGSVDGELILELTPTRELGRPDVLVYWAQRGESGASGLPDDAFLLGSLSGTRTVRFALPSAATVGGELMLYSLGHQEVFATTQLPSPPPEAK